MEKQSLKHLFSELTKTMVDIESIKNNLAEARTPIDKAHYKRTLELHNNRALHLSHRIDKFGGKGESMVQVTGQFFTVPGNGDIVPASNFVYFLRGVTVEEAKILMKAQAIKNNLIEESLKFNTIEFRNFITI